MKTVPDVNRQLSDVMRAIMTLNAMNSPVASIMIYSEKPVIRVSCDSPFVSCFKNIEPDYTITGIDRQGHYRQGEAELYGCKIIWSESLH